jgi:single-stranded DNA-specific DHH superfamily exonuclease
MLSVYLRKQRNLANTDVPPTYEIISEVVQKLEGAGYIIFMDNKFSSLKHLNDMHHTKINTCGTVHHNSKETPYTFNPKHLQLKKEDKHPKYKEA